MIGYALVDEVLARSWMRDSWWHGDAHWRCVAVTGMELARAEPGGDPQLAFLFGLLHDTRRENESVDPGHGPRAAIFARELAAEGVLTLEPARLDILCTAIELHASGQVSGDPVVGACWDADRLHLPRVGIATSADYLSTAAALEPWRGDAAAELRAATPPWPDVWGLLG